MKKGIAIETVILLLIGILVIGIMTYLIYKASANKTLSLYECKAKLMDICKICKNTNWDAIYLLNDLAIPNNLYNTVITPCSTYSEFFYWSDNTCCGNNKPAEPPCGRMQDDCTTLIGPS